jgi:hypothetical protein
VQRGVDAWSAPSDLIRELLISLVDQGNLDVADEYGAFSARSSARMFEYARGRGVRGFRADVLVGNTRMMLVFERASHRLSVKKSAGIEEVTMLFT